MIIDTHTHLLDTKFDNDRFSVIEKAYLTGIKKFLEVSCDIESWDTAIHFSDTKNMFIALGIHPYNLIKNKPEKKSYDKLHFLARAKKCLAIGEIGLDFHYNRSNEIINNQIECLLKQLNIAHKLNKPVILHCRDAYDDMINIFRKNKIAPLKGVVHCFSGTLKQALELLDFGLYLGIGGKLTYRKEKILKQIVYKIDINKLVVETDCPYLPPKKYVGTRNEPSYITETVKEITRIRKTTITHIKDILTKNALNLFKFY